MARIDLPDGRWVRLRPMWVDDELAIEEMAQAGTIAEAADDETAYARYTAYLRHFRDLIAAATQETSWGGSVGQMSRDDLVSLIGRWRAASEDETLPPA